MKRVSTRGKRDKVLASDASLSEVTHAAESHAMRVATDVAPEEFDHGGVGLESKRLPTFEGCVDSVESGTITGWVWDPANTERRIVVSLMKDGMLFSRTTASNHRSDLVSVAGEGNYAYSINLPDELGRGGPHTLHLRCAETGVELPGSPITVETSSIVRALAFESSIDLVSDELLTGWVYFPHQPRLCPVVNLRVGGRIVASAVASKFRRDLLDAGIGDGCHSFELQMPLALLDGEEHLIDVIEGERGVSLTKDPIRWRSTAGTALPHIRGLTRTSAALEDSHPSRGLAARNGYNEAVSGTRILFDISDLIYYLGHHANLTGIQRVQSSVVLSVLRDGLILNALVTFLSVDARAGNWVTIPTAFLLRLLQDLFIPEESRQIDFPKDEARFGLLPGSIPFDGTGVLDDGNPSVLCLLGAAWVHQDYMHRVLDLKRNFGTRYVMTVHDLIPIYAADTCDQDTSRVFIDFMRRALVHVDHILAVSENTATDLRRYLSSLRLPEPPITVTKNGSSFAEFLPPLPFNARTPLDIPERFVLFVATIEGRKNHQLMYDIWRRLIDDGGDPPTLICVGRLGWKATKFVSGLVETNYLDGRVLLLRDISDTDLRILYHRCMFTVYPTLYEGWGLPVGESLALGRICVSSDRSSLPEVMGDCGVIIDIDDFERSLETIRKLIVDRPWRAQLEEKIQRDYVPVTWRSVAETVVAACEHSVVTQWLPPYPHTKVPYSSEISFGKLSDEVDDTGEALLTRIADARRGHFRPGYPLDLQSFTLGEAIRSKGAWAPPEAWGTWLCHSGGELEFAMEADESQLFYVHVRVRLCRWLNQQPVRILANGECIWEGKIGAAPQDILLRVQKRASSDRPWRLRIGAEVDVSPEVRMEIVKADGRVPTIGFERLIIVPENDLKTRLDVLGRGGSL